MKSKKVEEVATGYATETDETVGAFEAKTHLSRLLREVSAGKRILITQRGRPVARLVPPRRKTAGGSVRGDMKGKIRMSDDFCAPVPEIEDYFSP